MSDKTKKQLTWILKRLAQLQGTRLDRLRLASSLQTISPKETPARTLAILCAKMGLSAPEAVTQLDPVHLPLLAYTQENTWLILNKKNSNGLWQGFDESGLQTLSEEALKGRVVRMNLRALEVRFGISALLGSSKKPAGFLGYVYETLRLYKNDILEACLASAFIGILSLATSLFSMQVYDRVIPSRSEHTLVILSSGVLLTILIELAMKYARAHLMDYVIVGLDSRLSREIFARLLNLRVDQLPGSVGSLAGQVRGYEYVRSFYTSSTLFTLIDVPMGILFLLIIMLIGHPLVALIPLIFSLIALWLGLSIRSNIMERAQEGAQFSNMKTGILVEAVEGIETIKSGSGGWKFLSRWIVVNRHTIANDLKIRALSDSIGYLSGMMQQISYAGLVVAGAWLVMQGHMTTGALIACSILSGRILAPIIALPSLLVQQAHARAALEGLQKLYQLKVDNDDEEQAMSPSQIKGHYQLIDVLFSYLDTPPALVIPQLEITPGERIAIIGPIGSGKSTLLRLLSGLYHPSQGRILIDGLDLSQIHRQVISEQVGYLQQDHRLFHGTLRENLLIGLPDPGDDVLMAVMERTGMAKFVSGNPRGLNRMINEGGKGLSGGQKQLLAFTRLILTNPSIFLLDEPTSSMDDEQEPRCIQVLSEEAATGKTMLVVTHKSRILPLISRIIVVSGNKIVIDGPRDAVLNELKKRQQFVQGTTTT